MTHISGHTSRQSLSRHLHQSPPATTQSCLNCIRPPSRAVFTSTESTFTWPSTMFNAHRNSLAHTEHCSLAITNRGKKNSFFIFMSLYIYFCLELWAIYYDRWFTLFCANCSKAWVGCGIWIKLRRPSATPKHKMLPVVCAFIHWVSEATLVNIWAKFLRDLRMYVSVCGIVHVLIFPHFDILHNGGSSLNMLMA